MREMPINRELFALYNSRENVMDQARIFFDEHADEDGNLTETDQREFDKQMAEVKELTKKIDYVGKQDLPENDLISKFLSPKGDRIINGKMVMDTTKNDSYGKAHTSPEYDKHFFNAIRGGFRNESADYLRAGVDQQGGYLLPSELDSEIATKIAEVSAMRQICRVIETNSRHLIPVQTTPPTAQWIAEGQEINLSSEEFTQVELSAYKLCAGCKLSNELLEDAAYDVASHLESEFTKALAAAEEKSFISGTGVGEPTGLLSSLDSDNEVTTASTSLSLDDLVNVAYSLRREYRQNAVWLMSDSVLQQIRQLKDATLNSIWTPSAVDNAPDRLLGYKIFVSNFMPSYEHGAKILVFGNFQYYCIADRGQRVFKPLFEKFALSDISAFLLIQRCDGKVIDKKAFKVLVLR